MRFKAFFILLGILSISNVKAQYGNNGCIDSLLIRVGAYCSPYYSPICGCDGKTYRNTCFAQNEGVISYTDGPCEPIAMDILSNPVSSFVDIFVRLKFEDKVDLWIYDYRGKLFFFEDYSPTTWMDLYVDVSSYPLGVYFIIAKTGQGAYTHKKMVKQ